MAIGGAVVGTVLLIAGRVWPAGLSTGRGRAPRPDVVLIVIDTWRWDALGANGAPRDPTPELDALSRRGVLFRNAIGASPWTLPSMASMLTGRYPTVHGAYGRLRDVRPIRTEVPLLAEIVSEAGYTTRAVVNALFLRPHFGFDRGFEVYDHEISSAEQERRAGPSVDDALGLLERCPPNRPLFFHLHVFDPHLPYDPPPPWNRRWTGGYPGPLAAPFNPLQEMRTGKFRPSSEDVEFVRGLYDGEVAYTDGEIGRFLREVERIRGDRERLVVVTSDHGEELGDHGGWEHGHAMYRELVRVPLIVVPPASWKVRPRVESDQVRLLDLFPTVLETAGAPLPPGLPGLSLIGLLQGRPTEDRPAYSEREHLGTPATAYRDGGYTLIRYPGRWRSRLFDTSSDPGEQVDRAAERPDVADSLERRARALSEALERTAGALASADTAQALDPELEEKLRAVGYLGE